MDLFEITRGVGEKFSEGHAQNGVQRDFVPDRIRGAIAPFALLRTKTAREAGGLE